MRSSSFDRVLLDMGNTFLACYLALFLDRTLRERCLRGRGKRVCSQGGGRRKESRLQGLKDQLAATEGEEAEELRQEVEDLEARIDELTEFKSGQVYHTRAGGEP